MIRIQLTNSILNQIIEIEKSKTTWEGRHFPVMERNRLRKISWKKSAYASNKIEGNPLTQEQAEQAIEGDPHRHYLKPEQEIRNYYQALDFLSQKQNEPYSTSLLLEVQKIVEKGAPKELIGLRGPTPPGVLFAVYDAVSGEAEYIPPEACDIPDLLAELECYLKESNDHPLLKAAAAHYQIVTIHPFEDGNGRTARLISGYLLDYYGYGFGGIGSLEEYYAYDPQAYYNALQMGLPALCYSGRLNPPHPEIWLDYFLHMMELYATKVCKITAQSENNGTPEALSYLNEREKALLNYLTENGYAEFTPIDISRKLGVTNKTISNRCLNLTRHGFLQPLSAGQRIRAYRLTDLAKNLPRKESSC